MTNEEKVKPEKKRVIRFLQNACIICFLLCVGGLLYYGAICPWSSNDVSIYQCYAVAFWRGWPGLQDMPSGQCDFVISQAVMSQNSLLNDMQQWKLPYCLIEFVAAQRLDQPYHTLPREYPLLAELPFALGLIVPASWYVRAFDIEMLLLAGCIYMVLQRWRSRGAALAYSLYLMVGTVSTLGARFDIIPAGLTLFAVICAERKRWRWAFVCLALATLLKLYPVILLVPFLLAQQREITDRWYAWRRWQPMAVFVGICVLVVGASLWLNVAGTLAPLGYFTNRPVEIESLSASKLWISSLISKTSLEYVYSFGSINIANSSSSMPSETTALLVVSLFSTCWLQWRGRIDLAMASLLTLLIVIVTGKVFSPQYLIWVIPLVAYVGQSRLRWLCFWILVGLLTSWIFPFLFANILTFPMPYLPDGSLFNLVLTVRNLLILAFIVSMLISNSLGTTKVTGDMGMVEPV
ncbi:MAG TPA: glycosyltransferase family 87 protein [Ktedonobacteraceae bacterium]|jgi:hypothetical protein